MRSIASDWLHDNLEVHGISGGEWLVECPWCSRVKLYANPEKLVFICFRCRERGKFAKLVSEVTGLGTAEAERLINSRTGVTSDELLDELRLLGVRAASRNDGLIHHDLPDEFVPCFNGEEWKVPIYLDDREIPDADLIRHGIGYALEGRYRNRVIVPVIFEGNRTFLARLMGAARTFAWTDRRTGKRIQPVKYLAPKGANLGSMLYGVSWVRPGSELIVVEGVFDAIRLIGLGFAAVATFGKRIGARQAVALRKLRPRSLTVMFDEDALSEAHIDALRLTPLIGGDVHVARLPPGFDPDSLGRQRGRAGIDTTLERRTRAGNPLDALAAALERL